ncbi:MAG: two-component regulator propeller domain-containing protein [Bacteroidota bacterium]
MNRILTFFLLLSIVAAPVHGQENNLGTPFIRNFSKKAYHGGTQNWDIGQNDRGVMYFANNEGLLIFDGERWDLLPLSNRTIVRSLAVGENGRIYVGGQNEFGYFEPSQNGILFYTSLMSLLPKDYNNLEDVWKIKIRNDDVFFMGGSQIIRFHNEQLKLFEFDNLLTFMGMAGDEVFVHDQSKGLLKFDGKTFSMAPGTEDLAGNEVTGLLAFDEKKILVSTLKDGFFFYENQELSRWNIKEDLFFKNSRIYGITRLDDNKIAIATTLDGLVVLKNSGEAVYHLHRKNGLQNNNVLSVFVDRQKNLWLGLANGLDFIEIGSPFSSILPDGDLEGTGYAVQVDNGKIFFGTNNGLYALPWKGYYDPFNPPEFEFVNGTQGQVWGLNNINGQLLLGHQDGAFEIKGNQIRRIAPRNGVWKFVKDNTSDNTIISGTYTGLQLFRKENNTISFEKNLEGLNESSRILIQDDNGVFWMAHPYKGIYKIIVDAEKATQEVKFYSVESGLPSEIFNHVFAINGEAVFVSEYGVYQYDSNTDKFVAYEAFNKLLGEKNRVIRLVEDRSGNIWFISEQEIGVLKIEDKGVEKSIRKIIFPELREKMVPGFEMIYPFDGNNVFFASTKGFIRLDLEKWFNRDTSLTVNLDHIHVSERHGDFTFGNPKASNEEATPREFPFSVNSFRFEFSASYFGEEDLVQYQYKLDGLENDWSKWTNKPEKEYTNLGDGNYEFMVRSRIIGGQKSNIDSYAFSIAPPWYSSKWAITMYSMLILAGVFGLILIPRRAYNKEKAILVSEQERIKEEHKQVVEETEKEIIKLRNEKLRSEVEHQSQELASAALHLVQKGEILSKIKGELEKFYKSLQDSEERKTLKKVIRLIDQDIELDNNWEQFSHHFDQVHHNFLKKLRVNFPQLTPKDHKLSAYLRMNLSTKEIAPLMNISIRGVEISRYRLRKKLNIDRNTNLVDFLLNI